MDSTPVKIFAVAGLASILGFSAALLLKDDLKGFSQRTQSNSRVSFNDDSLNLDDDDPEKKAEEEESSEDEEEEEPTPETGGFRASDQVINKLARTNSLRRSVSGFSLQEAKEKNLLAAKAANIKAPREVLSALQKGNTRFWMGVSRRKDGNAFERRALIMNQFPQVAVLGCSDSRVPVEIVFDQGLGEMFVVRVAGNGLSTSTSASLEYAVHVLNVKVVMILGHEGCGAVKAALRPLEEIEEESKNLADALKAIKAGLDESHLANAHDFRAYDREAVVSNILANLDALQSDDSVLRRVRAGELILVGCFYEISSGIVDFLQEVSAETLRKQGQQGRS